jgi:hypothetical protein
MSVKAKEFQEERRARARKVRAERGARVRFPPDDGIGAFPLGEDGLPIPEETPGQAESRKAFGRFNAQRDRYPWWPEYLDLRAEGWDWRRAALIAWLASPKGKRWPRTQAELATAHLGLETDRTLRQWREDDPEIEERVAVYQVRPLFEHRRDVMDALVAVAKKHDHLSFQDRRLFLQLTGDVKPDGKAEREIDGQDEVGRVTDDEARAITDALAANAAGDGKA